MGDNKIKSIAIAGASGMIGSWLSAWFRRSGITVFPIGRHHFTASGKDELSSFIERSDAVINLSGAPINHRWTPAYKKILTDSRVDTTRKLVDVISESSDKPRVFLSASAVGYYPPEGCHTEADNRKGAGFLSDLCQQWEREALRAAPQVRTVVMRFGLILSPTGGVLRLMELPTLFRVAALPGNGHQFFPWIDIGDLAGAVDFLMQRKDLEGVFNFSAPQAVTGRQFACAMAAAKRSWVRIGVPGFVFRAALGEAASFVLSGQCVIPQKLLEAGFKFISPDIDTFFHNIEEANAGGRYRPV